MTPTRTSHSRRSNWFGDRLEGKVTDEPIATADNPLMLTMQTLLNEMQAGHDRDRKKAAATARRKGKGESKASSLTLHTGIAAAHWRVPGSGVDRLAFYRPEATETVLGGRAERLSVGIIGRSVEAMPGFRGGTTTEALLFLIIFCCLLLLHAHDLLFT